MRIKKERVYVAVGGFMAGVLVHSLFDFGLSFSFFVGFLALVALGISLYIRRSSHVLVALFLLGATLGLVRFDIVLLHDGDVRLDALVGQKAVFSGVVMDEPDERETNTKLTVRITAADGEPVDERALVTTERYPQYSYGDVLEFSGSLDKPEPFVTDDGSLFDYAAYLGKDDIFYTMYFPDITETGSGKGNPVKGALFGIKRAFIERIGRVIEEPQASLLGGLVVGAKRSLGENLLQDFRTTGIIHIVVLSGYNVTIVAEFIMRVLSFLPALLTRSLGIFAIVGFAVMTGAGATIVRASIMAVLVILARAWGRTYNITYALVLAGFLMVFQNPKILVFDASFQLSFAATVGLIYLSPHIEQWLGWVPSRWQLREFATATLATQLFVLPMLLYKMGQLSIVAFPVNLLVLPIVPVTMLTGFLSGVVGLISGFVSLPFAYVTDALLSYQLFVVGLFSKIPFASVTIKHFPLWGAVFMYVLYGVLLWWLYRKSAARGAAPVASAQS